MYARVNLIIASSGIHYGSPPARDVLVDVDEAPRLEHSSIAAHVVYQSVGGCIDAMSASCRARRTAIPREV